MKKIILGILGLFIIILATIIETFHITEQKNPSVVKDENFVNTMTTDLNSDGIMDQISFEIPKTLDSFTLQVNDALVEGNEQNLKSYIEIVDIDPTDSFKEIAVSDYGPSSDYRTFFYFYDGKNLISMGETQGIPGLNMTFPGNGTFITQTRGQILQTWFYEDQFKLTDAHSIENIPQDLYEMNTPVIVLQPLPLQKSRTDSEQVAILEVGESATILSSDNKEWCLVETSTGVQGWFVIENFDIIKGTNLSATEVFDGLSMAD
ncbi:MAG: SH3 domain-containing protein [Candidatus Gracilibacteria bacterium]|jgi:hypothetical protein